MHKGALALALACLIGALSVQARPVAAQSDQTLADIRQELSVLYVEIQKLKRELSTTGTPSVQLSGDTVLERVGSIETALQTLTARTEQLEIRIGEIVRDGTNRIGDLEFRLVELEGGDVSQLGETSTLGGEAAAAPAPAQPSTPDSGGTELAIGEQADYDAAQAALGEARYRDAADGFARFITNYPGSPLAARAQLGRGKALTGLEDTREAARAYLASFSADPTGPVAAESLVLLGAALGKLGQVNQACLTLAEVSTRFPMSDASPVARSEMEALGCS
ncbi:MAG: tol-pal system protein YbgF [Rhodobacteraceae bacterium]|nr:tol-pal system protein YbgF [Paracoccaceae bacterium]